MMSGNAGDKGPVPEYKWSSYSEYLGITGGQAI